MKIMRKGDNLLILCKLVGHEWRRGDAGSHIYCCICGEMYVLSGEKSVDYFPAHSSFMSRKIDIDDLDHRIKEVMYAYGLLDRSSVYDGQRDKADTSMRISWP